MGGHPFRAITAGFSRNLALKVTALIVAGTAASSAVFYGIAGRAAFKPEYGDIIRRAQDYKILVLKESLYIFAFFTALMLAGVAVLSVIYSHRVAGPLYRVKTAARDMAKGKLGLTVRFRKHDVVHPLADSINRMSGNYKDRISRLEASVRDMKAAAHSLEGAVKAGDSGKAGKASAALASGSKEIEAVLEEIKL